MAVSVKATVKDLPIRLQTGSLNERKSLINDLIAVLQPNVLRNSDVPAEAVIKGICKILPIVLPRYQDHQSRTKCLKLVESLIVHHKGVATTALISSLHELFGSWTNLCPTKSLSKISLGALQWVNVIVINAESNISALEWKKLVEVEANLTLVIFGAQHSTQKLTSLGYKLLSKIFHASFEKHLEAFTNVSQTLQTLVFGSYFLGWLDLSKDNVDKLTPFKQVLIETLVKEIISSKNRVQEHFLKSLSPLLRLISHSEMKEVILPAMTKAMLRNPEVVVGSIAFVLDGLSIDLSQYSAELGKAFSTQLHAKDDSLREDAVRAMAALAKQCSDATAIELLLDGVFAVLNGSEGKLSVNSLKISLLQAAGCLSNNGVLQSALVPLCSQATNLFMKILDAEVHEGTLVVALENLALWASKFGREAPEKFIVGIAKGVGQASSSVLVQTSYLCCLQAAVNSFSTVDQKLARPILLKALDSAMKQSSQIPVVTKGIHAAFCLMKFLNPGETVVELSKLLNTEASVDKQVFTNDKFLMGVGSTGLKTLTSIAEHLILDPSFVCPSGGDVVHLHRWFRIITFALTSNVRDARNQAISTVKKITSSLCGHKNATILVEQLLHFICNEPQVSVVSSVPDSEHAEPGGGSRDLTASGTGYSIKADFLAKAIITISKASKFDTTSSVEMATSLLIPSHHPQVYKTHRNLWKLALKNLGVEISKVPAFPDVLQRALDSGAEAQRNAVKLAISTLARLNAGKLVPAVVQNFLNTFDNPEVYITDDDFGVYLTPADVVYDKSFYDNFQQKHGAESKNVKRENKAYSYKDQMEEMALRKELEEKRRKEGKSQEPKLTPKQKELLDQQLDKESLIRQRVSSIKATVDHAILILSAALEGNPSSFARVVGEGQLLEATFKGLKSPLSVDGLSHVLTDLRKAVFDEEDESLSLSIAAASNQIAAPHKYIKDPWSKETLQVLLSSLIDKIYSSTVGQNTKTVNHNSMEEDQESYACPFPTPAFHYSFTVIKGALSMEHLKDENDENETVHEKCLTIISDHASLRGNPESDESDFCNPDILHPKYLPISQIFSTLLDVLSKTEGRTRQSALNSLVVVAQAACGGTGCVIASNQDVGILITGLRSEVDAVRDAALRGLLELQNVLDKGNKDLVRQVWVTRFDPLDENKELSNRLWTSAELETYPELSSHLLEDIVHPIECVRYAAAASMAQLIEDKGRDADQIDVVLTCLLKTYREKLERSAAVLDGLGRVVVPAVDHWEPRSGIAVALLKLSPFLKQQMIKKVVTFFVEESLADRNDKVRKNMLTAAMETVERHGKNSAEELLKIFEYFLEHAPKDESFDNIRQSVVILMGSLAKHLESEDPKVRPIMRQLIIALNTPSQQVQEAVANCLPPLVPSIKNDAPTILENLISTLLEPNISYGERKGAAYGVAGIVKGLGILSLKQFGIMKKLTDAVTDKKNPRFREGALFAFEMLCNMLGRLFEPYIVHMLPHLLLCFGDPVEYVRRAADDTAKAVMSKLSAHGVKLVLPSLLNALDEDQWRTKTGSVELLGAMAFCAPKQLSSCLPAIVPKLIDVLSDSHHRVQQAGAQALKVIGSVIRNPEIQAIVPILLKALQDPSKKTGICLQTLLDTKFVHFIDAPSLALIMPVVQRAFQDRSTETRKMAAQIIGNMYSLTDQKDLSPYLPGILPGLKNSLLDPVPEVRAVSARALGAMVRGMGETTFEELLPWLMATLTSETSSVDRSGAAQGLAEVVGGLGVEKMNAVMPDIIKHSERTDIAPHVKDGYIMMFIYMPSVFPEEFTKYIGQITGPVLRALADENEFVRDTAYKAGQRLVMMYADSAITLLLPELERGLFDDNWRIRHSSVQLLGDLLYKISGVSGKMTTETAGEDDNFGTEQSQIAIYRRLGEVRCHSVLAGLYMGRSDVALMVRQASLHVWKVIVSNTPKTLREILPVLFNTLLGCLASNSYDKRQVAARTLGDLVKKLGERVLPEIIPILEEGLTSTSPEKRQGVCVGLSEIMASTSRDMVLNFVNSLVPTVRRALCDELPEVRQAAAKTFDSLHNTVGSRALDDILPPMLELLAQKRDSEERQRVYENTLDGLRQVMSIKARAVLPYLIPQLIAPPVNTRALASLAPVAGEALHRHLPKILPALVSALTESRGTSEESETVIHAETVILAISDDESETGLGCIMEELLGSCNKSKDLNTQRSGAILLYSFCRDTKCDLSQYFPQLLRSLIMMFTSKDDIVLQSSWNALSAVTKSMNQQQLIDHVPDVRQAVRFAVAELKASGTVLMPGLCLPKGLQPVLPILREAIVNGTPEEKEQASVGLTEIINLTTEESLKPSVVGITGPLIRILGDRFSHSVKVAVLDNISALLKKAGNLVRPFFPQLQTTFMKALNDQNRTVRLKAGVALGYLITIHLKTDPLFTELHINTKNADDSSMRETYLQALRGSLETSGGKITPPVQRELLHLFESLEGHNEDTIRSTACGCLGALLKWLPADETEQVLGDRILGNDSPTLDWTVRHGRSTSLFVALKLSPEVVYGNESRQRKTVSNIKSYIAADRIPVVQNALRACGYLFVHLIKVGEPLPVDLIVPFSKSMNHASNDVKHLLAVVATFVAKSTAKLLPTDLLRSILPMLVNGTKEKNSAVKATSETALVALLHLRGSDDSVQSEALQILDAGARDALNDVIVKVLRRVANQPEGKEETIDDTLLV